MQIRQTNLLRDSLDVAHFTLIKRVYLELIEKEDENTSKHVESSRAAVFLHAIATLQFKQVITLS